MYKSNKAKENAVASIFPAISSPREARNWRLKVHHGNIDYLGGEFYLDL
jgi:hypothetical protein